MTLWFPLKVSQALLRCLMTLSVVSGALGIPVLLQASTGGQVASKSASDLFLDEASWPYRVEMIEGWAVESPSSIESVEGTEAVALKKGLGGVLIRLESNEWARVDFGGVGVHTVPVRVTDIPRQASRIRSDPSLKPHPNLAAMLGRRTLDLQADPAVMLEREALAAHAKFVILVASTEDEDFGRMAADLAPYGDREDTLLILLSLGEPLRIRNEIKDARDRGWPGALVQRFLAEGYGRSLTDRDLSEPYLLMLSPEGRVLAEGPWEDGQVSSLLGPAAP